MVGKCMQIDIEYPSEEHDEYEKLRDTGFANGSSAYGRCDIVDLELPFNVDN